MRTIITRLYADAEAAHHAHNALVERNKIDADHMSVIKSSEDGSAASSMMQAGVTETYARTYDAHMSAGRALLVLRAPYGTARRAMETLEGFPSIDAGIANENVYVSAEDNRGSVLTSHPLLASNKYRDLPSNRIFGENPISHSPFKSSVISGGMFISKWFMPIQLIWTSKKPSKSIIHGGFKFSSMMGMATLSTKERKLSIWRM